MQIQKLLRGFKITVLALLALPLTAGLVYELASRVAAENRYSPDGEIIDVGGHRLHMLRKGSGGPTVVFESGLDSFGHLSWYKVEEIVSRFSTTVSYDRAGLLWSERGSSPKTSESMADDLAALLHNGGFTKPYIIVGHSIAGITLREFIARNSDDIAGIVLVDASHPDQFNRIPEELNASPSRTIMELANSFGVIRMLSPRSFPNTEPDAGINTIATALVHRSIGTVVEELESAPRFAAQASSIASFGDIPLVVITATSPARNDSIPIEFRDDFTRIWNELQEDLLSLSTNSQHLFSPGSGHYIQIDQPEIIIEAITNIIESLAVRLQ